MEGGKKVSCVIFLADQKIAISWKKCIVGHPIAQATSYCYPAATVQTYLKFVGVNDGVQLLS